MSYRLVDANTIQIEYPKVNELPCIFVDLPNGLNNKYHFINDLESLEAEPKHGRWIWQGHYLVCSECGKENDRTNYCPNCGAKMDEVEE